MLNKRHLAYELLLATTLQPVSNDFALTTKAIERSS
jgi:hypothetical protein